MNFASQVFSISAAAAGILAVNARAEYQPAFDPFPDKAIIISKNSGSFLGINVLEIDNERAKALNLKEERGVEVTRVEEDSPAAKGGLKVGDVVLEYNGQRLESVAQFIRMVHETPAGREIKLTVSRSGAQETVAIRTGVRKAMLAKADGNVLEIPDLDLPGLRIPDIPRAHMSWRSTVAGIEAESLDSQLAEFFGVKEGVLVRSVVRGSSADKAGFKAGDVIVKIDDSKVTTPREISSGVRSAAKKSVPVQIVRDRREQTLTLSIDDPDAPSAIPRRSIRR
jgi:serine protease Do